MWRINTNFYSKNKLYYIMENGYNNDSIDTSSLLLARGIGSGYGGGFGNFGGGYGAGGGVLTAEALANGTATKEAIDCNSTRFSDGLNSLSNGFENAARTSQITSVNKNISDQELRNSDRITGLSKDISDAEFRSLDRQRDIERMLTDNAKDAAKCCCDAKLQAMEIGCDTQKLVSAEANATRQLILEVEARGVRDNLASANAKIIQLETINALTHNHRP